MSPQAQKVQLNTTQQRTELKFEEHYTTGQLL
jgi:hypothetical protein